MTPYGRRRKDIQEEAIGCVAVVVMFVVTGVAVVWAVVDWIRREW